jgi:hypothetical protein
MRKTLATPQFAVFDDVLPRADFRRLWMDLSKQDYSSTVSGRWDQVHGLLEGSPLIGKVVIAGKDAPDAVRYPTGRPIDALLAMILKKAASLTPWIGVRERDWSRVTAMP